MSVKKPAAVRILEGNPGRRPIEAVVSRRRGRRSFPEHLPDDARGVIDVIKQSMPASVYSALDSFLLSAFGMAWTIHKMAAIEISNPNFVWITTNTKGTQVPSPWVKILNQQAQIMASLGDQARGWIQVRAALKLPSARQQTQQVRRVDRTGTVIRPADQLTIAGPAGDKNLHGAMRFAKSGSLRRRFSNIPAACPRTCSGCSAASRGLSSD